MTFFIFFTRFLQIYLFIYIKNSLKSLYEDLKQAEIIYISLDKYPKARRIAMRTRKRVNTLQ